MDAPSQPSGPYPAGAGPAWLERALVDPPEFSAPVAAERVQQAARRAARGWEKLGLGIDPAVARESLEDFAAALRADPAHVRAYLGVGRAVQLAASREPPDQVQALYTRTIGWLTRSVARVGALQGAAELHALDERLRGERRKLRARPRPVGASVPVQLERDAEGRVVRPPGRPTRFRPDSGELRALLPGQLASPAAEAGPPVPWWVPLVGLLLAVGGLQATLAGVSPVVAGLLLAAGLLVLALRLLVGLGRRTAGVGPGLVALAAVALAVVGAAEVQQRRAAAARPALERAVTPLAAWLRTALTLQLAPVGELPPLEQVAAICEVASPERPLRLDALHARLPAEVRAAGSPRQVLVVRRYRSPRDALLGVWLVDPRARRVLASRTFAGPDLSALEEQALAALTAPR